MRTPNRYIDCYQRNIPDEQMLADVIYAFNKRAKAARDRRYDLEKNLMYAKKEALLKEYFYDKIVCIHRQQQMRRIRYYDYEKEYDEITDPVWENCFYDYYYDREVWFKDEEQIVPQYFIYIEVGDKSFHSPINSIYKKYRHLEVKDLPDDFYTETVDPRSLLSKDFCERVFTKFVQCKYQKNTWKNLKF